jgi:hypothetical protein
MQIFEINKKIKDVLVLSGITIISKKKALKSKKIKESRKKRQFLLLTAMPKQTCPYKDITFSLGRVKGLLF